MTRFLIKKKKLFQSYYKRALKKNRLKRMINSDNAIDAGVDIMLIVFDVLSSPILMVVRVFSNSSVTTGTKYSSKNDLFDINGDLSAQDFLKIYSLGKLTSAPSIKRARAKLQQDFPELRGEKYITRKNKLQNEWRKDLGYEVNK